MSKNTPESDASGLYENEDFLSDKIERSIKNLAARQWNRLQRKASGMKDYISHAGHVSRRYKEHQSILNRWVDWYNRQSLTTKTAFGIAAAVIGAFTGVLVFHTALSLVAVSAALAFVSYLFFAVIMTHHGLASQKCEETLCDEISVMESEVEKTVGRLQKVENELKGTMSSLYEKNIEMAEELENMHEKAERLEKQNRTINEISDGLLKLNEKLDFKTDNYKENLSEAHVKLKDASLAADKLEGIPENLSRATDALSEGNEKLKEICSEYKTATDSFRHMNHEFELLLSDLKSKADEDTKHRQKISKNTGYPVDTCSDIDTETLLSDTSAFIDKCMNELDDMERINQEQALKFELLCAKSCLAADRDNRRSAFQNEVFKPLTMQ